MLPGMTNPRGRSLVATLLSVLLYASASPTVARAESGEFLSGQRIDSLCRPSSPLPCLVRVAATLRSATSGGPLPGKQLRFVAGNTLLCTTTTDDSGRAACIGVAPSGQSLAQTGYRAVFAGDDRYWSESAVVRASLRTSFSGD
jgi:hypothetical protein